MSMREGKYTLIGWLPKRADEMKLDEWMATQNPDRFELYDVSIDPAQSNDIAKQHPEVVDSMKKEMIVLWKEMRDEGLAGKNK